jgi:dipeptidyl aminopeptidase/acylaminoacyl peptidase
MLAAMRPNDPRYAALPLPGNSAVDAAVRCAVLCWPVIDPLGRYNHAKELQAAGKAKLAESVLEHHHAYWRDEAAMAEGSPTLALERGEQVQMPPVLYLQGTNDNSHPRANLERFIASYRKAGGRLDLHWFEGVGAAFLTNDPTSPQSRAAIEKIIEFVHREID